MLQKSIVSMILFISLSLNTNANNSVSSAADEIIQPISPTYINNAVVTSWRDNWFVYIAGGGSAFIGSPIGCEDLFGRIEPTLQIGLGKWHNPNIGTRVLFQGFEWRNGELIRQKYRHWHADLLFNATPKLARFDIIPFIGMGILDNRTADCKPFAMNYGIQTRYRLVDWLHISVEIGNVTSFKNADGLGDARHFGDHNLSVSAGLTWTFGRNIGWKKFVDAKPIIRQNERLSAYVYSLQRNNEALSRANNNNTNTIAELRKILEIEGLLNKYASSFDSNSEISSAYPINDYSGLNSLRKRLDKRKREQTLGINGTPKSIPFNEPDCLGAPIFFFFEVGSANLVDNSQLVNLDEIAKIIVKYGLRVDITGAADEQTGTTEINDSLGDLRSEFIADYLKNKGVPIEKISYRSAGGINRYSPIQANRNAILCLYL